MRGKSNTKPSVYIDIDRKIPFTFFPKSKSENNRKDYVDMFSTGCPNKHGNWETTLKSSLISDI